MAVVKFKSKVGVAASVVASSVRLGASAVVPDPVDVIAVEPAIPFVPDNAINLIATIPEPPRPPLIYSTFDWS
jgi:hypothetical protein